MKKLLNLVFIALSAFALAACDSMDAPSPLDTKSGSSANDINGDMPGDGNSLADGADGLSGRGINDMSGFDAEHINPEDIVCTVYFGFDKYAVDQSERGKIKKAADFFASNPNFKIVVVGHTDWWGTEEYNMLLSDKRCKAVMDYMSGAGSDSSKMEPIARGEIGSTIDAAKDSPEAKHDRRVEIVKYSK